MQDNAATDGFIWCAVPVFNNKGTVRQVVEGCLSLLKNVVVVDDGSTDSDIAGLLSGLDAIVLKHEKNCGKGSAILTASRYIESRGGAYMITIDADGQHYPEDLARFLPLLREDGSDLIIGCRNFDADNVPGRSRFGREFANFWLRVETGIHVGDCQSGFRAYPVKYLNRLTFKGRHYDFEAEVLAKAAWAGLGMKSVEIKVYYPRPEDRISWFRPFMDNFRLTLVHSMLVGRRLIPLGHTRLAGNSVKPDYRALLHPARFIRMLLQESSTPAGLAAAAAVGIFLATLPLFFLHSVVILYVAVRLNLNKLMALNIQHLCMPPVVPAVCIEIGYFMRNGTWLTDISLSTVFGQFSDRVIEWFLGSLIVAPAGALIIGFIVYIIASVLGRVRGCNAVKKSE
jgi:glycosyltransferase involved in cell wall biosynthesis